MVTRLDPRHDNDDNHHVQWQRPTSIVRANDGYLYITDGHAICCLAPNGDC